MGPRAGLDGCGKSRPTQGFDPRTVQSGSSVAIPTELPAPHTIHTIDIMQGYKIGTRLTT